MDNWPQIVFILLIARGVLVSIAKDGEKHTYDGILSVISGMIAVWLLWCGGFFS
jgi:hypothetical protein